jgi:hypothetical protein
MPHARAAEVVSLAMSVQPHGRVGMSDALGGPGQTEPVGIHDEALIVLRPELVLPKARWLTLIDQDSQGSKLGRHVPARDSKDSPQWDRDKSVIAFPKTRCSSQALNR